ncbi:hypothetical protein [Novosphingopyxis sp.]|uniref:hypothetical protein n=1 Tax=Novosphingopyxis sp. TaxID=2709690 RepID=UPI003B5C6034
MNPWFYLVHLDGDWLYRWFILNDYGKQIAMSCDGFWSQDEARLNLESFMELVKLEPA